MTEDIAAIQPNSYPISNTHLTEFTKRKNWIDRIINELKDFYHVITPSGKFIYCSPACQELVGYLPEEMIGRNLKEFIHIDDVDTFLRDFNLALKQREYRLFLRFRRKDDKFSMFEITGHPYFHERTNELKGFFSMARLYPGKTTSTMDSFLELRIENENLRRKLRNLGLEDTETPPYRSENRPSTGLSTPGSSNANHLIRAA
ncbi:hypothetical protein K7432_009464 [Basidiobolus ranarum]|uniref:PAS domain-containing protein n=1 Tax=Basidiobolus ranarum TaxID=34480 RepID=A0ABR2VX21_9FUNG